MDINERLHKVFALHRQARLLASMIELSAKHYLPVVKKQIYEENVFYTMMKALDKDCR